MTRSETIRQSVTLDEESKIASEKVPMGVSALVRVLLVAAASSDKEFEKYLKDNPKARETLRWLSNTRLGKLMK